MGVPAFFRWLCIRNPRVLWEVQENADEFESPSQNPEIDNLYIDMNGLIHPCSHPEVSGIPVPVTLHDMFINIYNYVDRLIDLIRPKNILYLAIDGVAPRAKMNQQRARRFRAAQESQRQFEAKIKLRDEFKQKNNGIQTNIIDDYIDNTFDSNQITPGTEFMQHLTIALQYYIYERLNNHPLWAHLIVIFSDASIPGEGEHKILEFIRNQRSEISYNPNTKHCIYGADADLIMLGLSTHEPWFYIIRETIMQNDDKQCSYCQQRGHFFTECRNRNQQQDDQVIEDDAIDQIMKKQKIRSICINFQMVKIYVVRQWLQLEIGNDQLDIERVVDDFIFLCFLVGNDFLPHIPALRITEGGIDCLIVIYKQIMQNNKGQYITDCGNLNLQFFDKFLRILASVEETLMNGQQKKLENIRQRNNMNFNNPIDKEQQITGTKTNLKTSTNEQNQSILEIFKKELKEKMKEITQFEMSNAQALQATNQLPQWQSLSLRQRYYTEKFHVEPRNFLQLRDRLRQNFIEALSWTLKYYYNGCIDWGWYYQFHYAPFAQDIEGCTYLDIQFSSNNIPFQPFQQLLAVLPERSKQFLPEQYHWLLTQPQSPIADFYPTDFFVDLKGKKFAWLGEVVLPFVDAPRLVNAHNQVIPQVKNDDLLRNKRGQEIIFYNKILNSNKSNLVGVQVKKLDRFALGITIKSPLPTFQDIPNNQVTSEIILSTKTNQNNNFIQNQVLQGCIEPHFELDQQYIQDCEISKRAFSGEAVKRMICNILGLPQQFQSKQQQYYNNSQQNRQFNNNTNTSYNNKLYYSQQSKRRGLDLNELDQLRKQIKPPQ